MTARKKFKKVIPGLFKEHIQGTESKSLVINKTVFLCHLTKAVQEGNNFNSSRVYINSKVIKHLYDSKPAEEFDFLINYIHKFIKYPDCVYKNKPGKRGDLGFLKELKNESYFCLVEVIDSKLKDESCPEGIYIVTAFRLREGKKENYELLWSWRDGLSSS